MGENRASGPENQALTDSNLLHPPPLCYPYKNMAIPPPFAGSYHSIVIDPPWDQGKTGLRSVRPNQGRALDYPTMSQEEILACIPLAEWAASNAFLWLWATNSRSRSSGRPVLQQAFELMEAWGFRYYTLLTWSKGTGPCPFGPYQITTEHCLFGYRGKCKFSRQSLGKMKTVFEAGVTRHSEKPTVFYENIRRYFPAPYLDLFSRRPHEGFDSWGNEVDENAA